MRIESCVTIDFETNPIEPRPNYPPEPVGVAIREPGRASRYYAWGHPSRNSCTKADARRALRKVWNSRAPLLFHNAKFDVEVGCAAFGLKRPRWERIHDTTFLAFLVDPNAEALSLKPLAEKWLGMPPTEELAVQAWLVEHVPEARRAKTKWATCIGRAPGSLVRPYAIGDVERTWRLFKFFRPKILADSGMEEAYERERRLIPVLLDMEEDGVPVNVDRLAAGIERGEADLDRIEGWIRRYLKVPELDLSSKEEFADALENAGVLEEWILTPTGKRSVAADALAEVLTDRTLFQVLQYRARLMNQLQTFARPWFAMAETTGKIFCVWNQVRQASERERGRAIGARTGRLSSSPNFQNVQRDLVQLVRSWREFARLRKISVPVLRLPIDGLSLIDLRSLIAAPRGERLFNLDYSQQELRILAHYAGGDLLRAYVANPDLDLHEHARVGINAKLGTSFPRRSVKDTGFGIIYGMGLGLLAEKIDDEVAVAKLIRATYREIFPGLAELEKECKRRGREGEPLRTWGGRLFLVEEPKFVNGYRRTFEYKLINTLIQGSAADCTKEAMIRYYDDREREGRMLLTVHDELLGISRMREAAREIRRLRTHMESIEFAVPMLADGKGGVTWRTCK